MIGVLIFAGIIGYALVYSGLSELPNSKVPATGTLKALWPSAGASTYKAGASTGSPQGTSPRTGRQA